MLIIRNKHHFDDLRNIVDESNIGFVHCPIVDCGIIDDAKVLQLAFMVARSLLHGDVIYLHCWGGHGRTGTVVCLVLHILYQVIN